MHENHYQYQLLRLLKKKKKKKKTASYTQHKGRAENLLHVVGNFKREQIHFPYLQIYFLFFLNIFSSMTTQEMVL